jgi:RimJ/RimL family protein N-acetyltransferase
MSDPATMAYNVGFDVPYPGYHRDTGCIDFPESDWARWLDWCAAETASGARFHAIVDVGGTAVGEAGFRVDGDEAHLHLVIDARHAGHGHGSRALALLVAQAFRRPDVHRVVDEYPADREPAETVFVRAGFVRQDRIVVLTRPAATGGEGPRERGA